MNYWGPIAKHWGTPLCCKIHHVSFPLAIWASNGRPHHFKQDRMTRLPLLNIHWFLLLRCRPCAAPKGWYCDFSIQRCWTGKSYWQYFNNRWLCIGEGKGSSRVQDNCAAAAFSPGFCDSHPQQSTGVIKTFLHVETVDFSLQNGTHIRCCAHEHTHTSVRHCSPPL